MSSEDPSKTTPQAIPETEAEPVVPATVTAAPSKGELSDEDLEAVSGGTAGVKKTMSTQV